MNPLYLGLQLMAYGILGVFTVLALFMLLIKVLLFAFPYNPKNQ
jgi:hypothetical protein